VSAGPRYADGGCVVPGLACLLCFVMAVAGVLAEAMLTRA